jgi:hypothetical protein
MRHTYDEAGLVADAEAVLGVPVVAAGMFGFQNLLGAEMVGATVGAVGFSNAFGASAGAIGAGLGGFLATKAAAEDQGATVKLIVAVTADDIHVLRWGHDTDPQRVIRTLPRATTTVDVSTFGLSRILTLSDSASDQRVTLHASVAPYARQSGPDKDVLAVLTGPPA